MDSKPISEIKMGKMNELFIDQGQGNLKVGFASIKLENIVGQYSSATGMLFQGPDGGFKVREDFIKVKITMPCGKEVVYANTGEIPNVDTPCPCGDPNHWIVRFEKNGTEADQRNSETEN